MDKIMNKIYSFMQGRYGIDDIYKDGLILYLVLVILDIFFDSKILYVLQMTSILTLLYRSFSKQINKRKCENDKYLKFKRKMLKPIKQLKDATKKVAAGDFSVELETERNDEIGDLTHDFNKMVKGLSSIECLQKDFINNVSHELKTPISSIQGFAKLLDDETLTEEERKEYISIIIEESDRLLNISTNILKLSKLQNQDRVVNKEEIDISEQIRKVISVLEPKWKEKDLKFNVSLQDAIYYGDSDLTFQVWMNLIDNAIKFSNNNSHIDVKVKKEKDLIKIEIKDYGIGMDEGEKDKMFNFSIEYFCRKM